MSIPQITQQAIESFIEALVRADAIRPEDLKDNRDLVVEALKISASKDGLQKVMYNYSDPVGNEPTHSPAISAYNGQEITRPVHDPIEIFTILYTSKRNELREEQRKQQEREKKRQDKWSYIESQPYSERYDVNLGRYITLEDIKEFPCAHPRCFRSFDTEEDAKKHAWQHYGR